jgi:C-terminal processing protease CtpA/Prc
VLFRSQFVGFIINSQLKEWQTGQIKFRIFPDSAVFYANDHSAKSVNRAYMFSKNIIFFDEFAFFIRKYPEYEDKFLISTFGNLQPYFETLNNKTCYLRVPSFSKEFCPIIDSVIDSNKQTITKTENLIIDLRSNGGGSTNCWQNIIPYIYTNPYRAKNNIYLSTELNNINYQKNYGNNPFFDKLNKNLGKFVKDWEDYTDIKFDTIYKYPQNVAIIVDERCASATEQFLLTARQSRKVKIFGKITAGALDFSNMNTVNSPCEDFVLSYATSKDVDIDNYPIEGIGIQPDFYLDNAIQEYKWVDYVNEILNGE